MPRQSTQIDPATGRPLPQGVQYRGPAQYRARALVDNVRVTSTFERASEAKAWLEAQRTDARRGAFRDLREAEKCTLGEVIDRYMSEVLGREVKVDESGREVVSFGESEKDGAEKECTHLVTVRKDPVCGIKMARLKSKDCYDLRRRMEAAGYAPATVLKRLNLVQTIIEYARMHYGMHLASNPVQEIKKPTGADVKRDRRLVPATGNIDPKTGKPEKGEEETLYAQLEREQDPWLALMTTAAILTAWRQGELLGLRWSDLKLDNGTATIVGVRRRGVKNKQGGRKGQERPMIPEAVDFFRSLPRSTDGRVFPVEQDAFKTRYARAVARAGIEDFTFHDLRHEGTTRLAKIIPNPMELMRYTGHKDIKSLLRYYDPTAQELADAARQRKQAAA